MSISILLQLQNVFFVMLRVVSEVNARIYHSIMGTVPTQYSSLSTVRDRRAFVRGCNSPVIAAVVLLCALLYRYSRLIDRYCTTVL